MYVELLQGVELQQNVEILQDVEPLQNVELKQDVAYAWSKVITFFASFCKLSTLL